jgi:hypothetical protein
MLEYKERNKGFPVIITRTPFTRKQRFPLLFQNPLISAFIRIIEKTGRMTVDGT